MITSERGTYGYVNDLTRHLDKYLVGTVTRRWCTYIYDDPCGDNWLLRVPGATRGYVTVVEGIITEVKLHEDSFCYKPEVLDTLNQFLGMKIKIK